MDIAHKKLVQQLWEALEPVVLSRGMELIEIEFQREPRGWVLRLYLDKPGGVSLEDCSIISREVGDLLDVRDMIAHSYHLEVSSPGLERPVRKPGDFQRYAGQTVKITLLPDIGRRRVIQGNIIGLEGDLLRLDCGQAVEEVPLNEIQKARLVFPGGDPYRGVDRACKQT